MKKILTLFMSLLIAITTLSVFSVPVSARGVFDDAKTIKPLEYYNIESKKNEKKYYKIQVNSAGTLIFYVGCYDGYTNNFEYSLKDSNGNVIKAKSGRDFDKETYTLSKEGTYYLEAGGNRYGSCTAKSTYYTFEPSPKPTIKMTINAYVGDVIDLSGATTNYKGKISWKSSNKKIATVSNGEVTALKVGKAKITATLSDNTEAVITINVKKNKQPTVSLAINVTIGDEIDLSAITQNYKGDITWNVTDKKVLSVKDGKVSTLKKGKAKVRAYTDDGIFAEITINVK